MKNSRRAALLFVVLVLIPLGVLGAQSYQPPKASGSSVTLQDALLTALAHNPEIYLAREDARFNLGVQRQSAGQFDSMFMGMITASRKEGELLPAGIAAEEDKRRTRTLIAEALGQTARNIEATQGDNFDKLRNAQCPRGITFNGCVTEEDIRRFELVEEILGGLGVNFDFDSLTGIINNLVTVLARLQGNYLFTEANLLLQVADLGVIPRDELRKSLAIDLIYTKPFRSGASISGLIMMEGSQDNFIGKPLFTFFDPFDPLVAAVEGREIPITPRDFATCNPQVNPSECEEIPDPETGIVPSVPTQFSLDRLGGKGIPNQFTSQIGVEVNIPLARGAGRRSAQANERAADANVNASLEDNRQASVDVAFNTVAAYWRLVGAQEQLALTGRSRLTKEDLLQSTDALVEGEELARIEATRARAEVSRARGREAQARQRVVEARLELARTMGLSVETSAEAPSASHGFPRIPDDLSVAELVRENLDGILQWRYDLNSADDRIEARKILEDQARNDLKPIIDLKIEAGSASLVETPTAGLRDPNCRAGAPLVVDNPPFTNVLQQAPPSDCTDIEVIRWWNPKGHFKALFDEYADPAGRITLNFEFPMKNRTQRGRVIQARAQRQQEEIRRRDLERRISANVVDLALEVDRSAANVKSLGESVEYYRQSLEADQSLFRAGERTLIDVLKTEDALTSSEQQLINAVQTHQLLLNELRLETGSLVRFVEEGDETIRRVQPYGYDFTP